MKIFYKYVRLGAGKLNWGEGFPDISMQERYDDIPRRLLLVASFLVSSLRDVVTKFVKKIFFSHIYSISFLFLIIGRTLFRTFFFLTRPRY
jgi:hypothetical protein